VTEAVRSSRMMSVPEMPKGLDLEEEPTNVNERASTTPPPLPAPPAEPMPLPAPPEGPRAIPLPATPPAARPIEASRAPASAAKRPVQQSSSSGMWILVFLVLLVGIGVGIYMFRDKIFGGGEYDSKGKPPKPLVKGNVTPDKRPVAQPPTAAPPAAKLEEQGGSVDLASPTDGEIAWIVDNGATVEAGAVVAKLKGFDKFEKARERATKDMTEAQGRLDFYKTKNNPAKIAEKEGLVKAAQDAIAAADKELAAISITATSAGGVQLLAGAGAKVKAGDPVIRLGGDPVLVATFDAGAAAAGYKTGATCVVAAEADRDKEYACVVEAVDGNKVSVRLVSGAAAAKGDGVILVKK
jgi:biotin carboxyl carrier protein